MSTPKTRTPGARPDWATVCAWVDSMRETGLWPLSWTCSECGRSLRGTTRASGAEELAEHLLVAHGVQLLRCGNTPPDQHIPCCLPDTHEGRHASSAGDWS